ncbi:MAG: hypothetical protein AAF235_01515, partial [Planctomycetota bacterium]
SVVHDVIYDELCCGDVLEGSRERVRLIAERAAGCAAGCAAGFAAGQAEGGRAGCRSGCRSAVLLCCTELGMLFPEAAREPVSDGLCFVDSGLVHARAAAAFALGDEGVFRV